VVDLMCDARSYLPQNYSADGFHPSDSGYAFMAEAVLNAVNASSLPAPRSDCPQMHLAD
jgi:lysophospholipase L1-like esterase